MYLDTHVEGHNNVMLRSQSSQRCYWIIRHKVISVSQHFAKFPETLSSTFIDRFARCLLEKLPPPPSFSVCAILLIAYLCRVSASAPTIAREYASKRITLYFLHTIWRVVTGLLPSAIVLEIRGSRFIHLFDNIGDDPIFRAISSD